VIEDRIIIIDVVPDPATGFFAGDSTLSESPLDTATTTMKKSSRR
jgi:hypothetical protein